MTYEKFNSDILAFYVQRATSSFFTLAIDTNDFASITPLSSIPTFQGLKAAWSNLLIEKSGIPQYFGLIAVQCLAASLMQNDKINSANAYQVRLCQLLNLEDNSFLQAKFRGSPFDEVPVQEQIWWSAKRFLHLRFGFNLKIPDKSSFAGRFVQYPKSQALLNTEDLLNFTVFFSEEFQVGEVLTLDFFKERLDASLYNIALTSHASILLADPLKKEQCFNQIFNYYNAWTGTVYRFNPSKRSQITRGVVKSEDIKKQRLLLIIEMNELKFYDTSVGVQEISHNNIFSLKGYKYLFDDLMIFCQHDYYPEEFVDSRFIDKKADCYVLLNRFSKHLECRYLESDNIDRVAISEDVILYRYRYSNKTKTSPLKNHIPKISPVRLRNGLRLNRGNQYLIEFGPEIVCDLDYLVIFNNRKCDYDPETAIEGTYKIRTDYFHDIEFEILPKVTPKEIVNTKAFGWDLKTFSISSNFDIEGWAITANTKRNVNAVRLWIQLNTSKKKMELGSEKNILLNAINNSKR